MTILRRTLTLLLLLGTLLLAVGTTTDITGSGAAVQIASSGTARWVQIIADPGNANPIRVGDAQVSSTRGARIAAGGGLMLPPQGQSYGLQYIYVYAASGDKVSVLWGD